MEYFLWFWFIGGAISLLQTIYGDDIFEFNIQEADELDRKKKIIKNAPIAWRVERMLHRFFGSLIGWMALWALLDLRLNLISGQPDLTSLSLVDLALFLIAFIGINGRLPTIAHSLHEWLKR